MPSSSKSALQNLSAYSELKRRVRWTIAQGRERALAAVEREKVRTSWEVGRLILEHILLHQKRGDYGGSVLKRLSKDIGLSYTELKYMVEFARTYPKSLPAGDLSWSHYTALLSINDSQQRKALTGQAVKNGWDRSKLRSEIRKLKPVQSAPASRDLLEPRRGKIGVHQIIDWHGRKAYDLGFSTYFEIKGRAPKRKNPPEKDLYTYETRLENVFDADTPWTQIHLGFGIWTRQKLRLRGIDAPELNTRDGLEAKRYVEKVLKAAKSIIISTTKSDKYDRYLADVFYKPARDAKTPAGSSGEVYLNQELIEKGYAVRVDE